jgi:hypothetical protein
MAKNGILVTIISIILLYGCGDNRKGPPSPGFSYSISDSKEKDVFQFEVVADKSAWILDSALQFEIRDAWIENQWFSQVYLIGKPSMSTDHSAYQLIMKLKIDTIHKGGQSPYYYFIGNKHLEDNFIYHFSQFYYSTRLDTFRVPLYRETTDHLPPKKDRKAFDSLTFVKK